MTPTEPGRQELCPAQTTIGLEELIPIAVVISAGCERCAQGLVRRLIRRRGAQPLIERTLGIIERVGSAECLLRAVGPDVVTRLGESLRAAREVLSEAAPSSEARNCCREKGRRREEDAVRRGERRWENFEGPGRREGA